MKGRLDKDEDSGSDWDSMSEMEPAPKKKGHKKAAQSPSRDQPEAVPRKLKSMTFVDSEVGKKNGGDKPPFDFKPETTSLVQEEIPSKPGKPKKGNTYFPDVAAAQRRVSFVEEAPSSTEKPMMNGSMPGTDSDSEDPLYSTVKRKVPSSSKLSPIRDVQEEQGVEKLVRVKEKPTKSSLQLPCRGLQGLENKGFIDDEAYDDRSPHFNVPKDIQRATPTFQGDEMSTEKSGVVVERKAAESSERMVGVTSDDGLQPLILTLGTSMETAGKQPIEIMNKAIANACTFVTFPIYCFALIIHHFLRFLLQGLVKLLIVDSLILVVEYLIRPFMGLVIKPLLNSFHGASVASSNIILVCLKPVIAVLQSFRLVEINNTRKYSVEEI